MPDARAFYGIQPASGSNRQPLAWLDQATVDAVNGEYYPSKIEANGLGDTRELWQRLWQQRGHIAVARDRDEWSE
jgi:hypothetical protein